MNFIKSLVVFFAPILIVLFGVNYFAQSFLKDNNAYYSVTIDKESRLANLTGPRIVFVGASTVAFGIDSREIEKQTQVKTVNMGVSAEFGLSFILNEAASCLRSGDIVILSVDYFLSDGEKKAQSFLLDNNANASKFLPSDVKDEILYKIYHFQRIASGLFYLKAKKSSVYLRNAFNKNGDNVLNFDSTSTYNGEIIKLYPRKYNEQIDKINNFIGMCKAQNARVYFSFPPCSYSYYNANKNVIRKYDAILRSELHCPFLDSIQSYVYPDHYFFDMYDHLNASGKEMKTQKLISKIDLIIH